MKDLSSVEFKKVKNNYYSLEGTIGRIGKWDIDDASYSKRNSWLPIKTQVPDKTSNQEIIAYASYSYNLIFVLEDYFCDLKATIDFVNNKVDCGKKYKFEYVVEKSFYEQYYHCSNIEMLPIEMQKICWIDDSFLTNELAEFDYKIYEKIEKSKGMYVNPVGFSLNKFFEVLNSSI